MNTDTSYSSKIYLHLYTASTCNFPDLALRGRRGYSKLHEMATPAMTPWVIKATLRVRFMPRTPNRPRAAQQFRQKPWNAAKWGFMHRSKGHFASLLQFHSCISLRLGKPLQAISWPNKQASELLRDCAFYWLCQVTCKWEAYST